MMSWPDVSARRMMARVYDFKQSGHSVDEKEQQQANFRRYHQLAEVLDPHGRSPEMANTFPPLQYQS